MLARFVQEPVPRRLSFAPSMVKPFALVESTAIFNVPEAGISITPEFGGGLVIGLGRVSHALSRQPSDSTRLVTVRTLLTTKVARRNSNEATARSPVMTIVVGLVIAIASTDEGTPG